MDDEVTEVGPFEGSEGVHVPVRRWRWRSRRLRVSIAGLCAVAVALILVLILPQGSPSAGAAAAVRRALASTLSAPAMSFGETEEISVGSTSISTTGQGTCDLQLGDCELTLNFSGAESDYGPETARYVGDELYFEAGPAIRRKLPTPWLSVDMGSISSLGGENGSESPLDGLSLLAQSGADVTEGGPTTLNGQPVTQYSVTLSGSTIHNLLHSAKLPSWIDGAVSELSGASGSELVDVDAQGRLAYVSTSVSVGVSGETVLISSVETVTGYGSTVAITAPPANEVTPYETALANGDLSG